MVVFVQKWFCLEKVVLFGKNVCIRAKGVIFGQISFGKTVIFWQSGCIRAKMVVFGQKWL